MSYFLIIVYTLLFLFILQRINKKTVIGLPNYSLPILFIGKLGFAGLFIYVYTYVYGDGTLVEDAGRFFRDSKILYNVFLESPRAFYEIFFGRNEDFEFYHQFIGDTTRWIGVDHFLVNDTRNIIRINTVLHFISNGNLFIHFLFFTFFSFLGILDVFLWIKKKSNLPPLLLLSLLLFTPNLAFWGSSILKEPIMILGVTLFLRGLFDNLSLKNRSWRLLIGGIFMISFKPYVFLSLIIAYLFYLFFSRITKNQFINLGIFSVFGLASILITGTYQRATNIISDKQKAFINVSNGGLYVDGTPNEYFYIELENRDLFLINEEENTATQLEKTDAFLMKKAENFKRTPFELDEVGRTFSIYLDLEGAESKVPVTLIDNSFLQLIKNIPEAIFNSFMQPLPKKKMGIMQIISFLENVFFGLLMLSLFVYRKTLEIKEKRLIAALVFFSLLVGMIIGWTTPVAGAIVRYIIPAKITILLIFAICFDYKAFQERKWKQKINHK